MSIRSLEILVEDRSTEQALHHLVPKIAPGSFVEFNIRSFDGKHALLKRLPDRLRGYADRFRFDPGLRILVVVDLDDDDCNELKQKLEAMATSSGIPTLRSANSAELPVVATRIAIEELEAWFIGDIHALRTVYPRVPQSLGERHKFRLPDAVKGGTWEALERLLQSHGYHQGGLRKIALADEVARHMDVEANRSPSFCCLRDGLRRLTSWKATV